ncbi:MAG: hypothetical protein IPN19_07460 [Elusimicrobia bacterium]|nr:hypothetical protein [Elusimicrobiota bacterium]
MTIEAVEALANEALRELSPYLKGIKPLREGMTMAQLKTCQVHLETMLIHIHNGKLPSQASRLGGMGRMIADSWPFDEKLGDVLSRAERAYNKL